METSLRKENGHHVRFTDEMVGFQLIGGGDEIGKLDHASFDGSWATVAVGLLNKTRYAVPAWAITVIDAENETVIIGFGRDDVLESPAYDNGVGLDMDYRDAVADHYREVHGRNVPLKKIA
jgi:hypothetical protein